MFKENEQKGFKNPRHGNFPLTFFRKFFGSGLSVKGGRGVPPLSVKKRSIKNWPKNRVLFGRKVPFSAKIFPFLATDHLFRALGGAYPLRSLIITTVIRTIPHLKIQFLFWYIIIAAPCERKSRNNGCG